MPRLQISKINKDNTKLLNHNHYKGNFWLTSMSKNTSRIKIACKGGSLLLAMRDSNISARDLFEGNDKKNRHGKKSHKMGNHTTMRESGHVTMNPHPTLHGAFVIVKQRKVSHSHG